jgi:hypothetical protein
MANSFWDHVIQISRRVMNPQDVVPTMKSKNLIFRTKYLFSRKSYICPVWFFIFDTDQAQIFSAV